MSKKRPPPRIRKIAVDPNPEANLKALAGAEHDDWNNWLASTASRALPVNQNDEVSATEAMVAVYSGMIDMKPADPIEGILISQLMVANQGWPGRSRQSSSRPGQNILRSLIKRHELCRC